MGSSSCNTKKAACVLSVWTGSNEPIVFSGSGSGNALRRRSRRVHNTICTECVCMHCPRLHGWRQCASAEQQKSAFDWVQLKGQPSATSANSPPGNPLHPTLQHLLHRLFTPVLFSITSPLLDAACLSVCLPLLLQQLLLLSYCSLAFPLSPAHVFRSTLIRLLPCP